MDFYYIVIGFVFFYIFVTGFHDEGNLIATIISSRSMKAKTAFIVASAAQFLGTILLSTTVTTTMGRDIIKYEYLLKSASDINLLIFSGIFGAMIWNFITWYWGIPSSSSHALIGGMIGPFFIKYGFTAINTSAIIIKAIIPLFLSPIIGFIIGYIIMNLSAEMLRNQGPEINNVLKKLQYITVFLLNAGQGANDAQKGMGLIVIIMMIARKAHNFEVPYIVKVVSALMISSGLILGGLRMIKSVGTRMYRVKPFHSFNAQVSSLLIVVLAALIGAPTSGTQIINSSVLGVGAYERPRAVRWQFARGMVMAWIITIPVSFIISSLIYAMIKLL